MRYLTLFFISFVYLPSHSLPTPIIIGGAPSSTEDQSKRLDQQQQSESTLSCKGLFRVRILGEAPLAVERGQVQSQAAWLAPDFTSKSEEASKRSLLSRIGKFFGTSYKPAADTKSTQTLEEKRYNSFVKHWSRVIKKIESSKNLKFNTNFFRSYWVQDYERPVSEWEKFSLVQFTDTSGEIVFYFFSESEKSSENRRSEVKHRSNNGVHAYNGYFFGPLDQLDVTVLRSSYYDRLNTDELKAIMSDQGYDTSRVEELDSYYQYVLRGELEEFILPLSEDQSLKITSDSNANKIQLIEADNANVFTRVREESSDKLEQLFIEWRRVMAEGADASIISNFYKKQNANLKELFENLNREDLDFTDLQLIIRQIGEKYRNLSRQITVFSLLGLEQDVLMAFSALRMGALNSSQIQELLERLSLILDFKRFHLSQLQNSLQVFENLITTNYDKILELIDIHSQGGLREAAKRSFEEAFNIDIRSAVALNFEASYLLEERRNARISQLITQIRDLRVLSADDGLKLLEELKILFSISEKKSSAPDDIEVDLPILDFIYLFEYKKEHRPYGGGGGISIII